MKKGKCVSLVAATVASVAIATGVSGQALDPFGTWQGEIKCDQLFADQEVRLTFSDLTIHIRPYSEGTQPDLIYFWGEGGTIPVLVPNYGYYANWFNDPAHPNQGTLAFSEAIVTNIINGYMETGQASVSLKGNGTRTLTGDSTVIYYQTNPGTWPADKYTATCEWKFSSAAN